MVNGVVINENIRGQGVPLVIEDAVQETTVSSGAISAEFGRFSGGVVNAVTKSGGNRFSGSFRTSFINDNWRALTPQPGDVKVDDTVPTYEFTGWRPDRQGSSVVLRRRPAGRSRAEPADDDHQRPVRVHRQGAPLRRQAHLLRQPEPHGARRLPLPQPRPGEPELVQRDGPAEPLQPVAAGGPDVVQLHRRALEQLLPRGHGVAPRQRALSDPAPRART